MSSQNDTTEALLRRAHAGDDCAVNALLEAHRAALARMVALRLDPAIQRRVDASDVVQDVLVEAHGRLPGYLAAKAMPFHLWLRQLARDRMIDLHRAHRRAERRSVDREERPAATNAEIGSSLDLIARLCDHERTPAAAATWREWAERFAAAIDSLDATDREIILMRHFEHLSNQDAARTLGLSEPAAGMRYLRALRKLRTVLADTSVGGGA